MNRKVLVFFVVLILFAAVAVAQLELEGFLKRLKDIYSDLGDLQATVTIKQQRVGDEEKEVSQWQIETLVKQQVLRLKCLEPAEMRGQIYTLKGHTLSQYIPVINTIIVQEITEGHLLYPFLELLNFDLEKIVARLREEGFALALSQRITLPVSALELGNTVSQLAQGYPAQPLDFYSSLPGDEMESVPLSLRVSQFKLGDYLLQAIPSQEGPVSKELIWINPQDLIPRRVETHRERMLNGKIVKEVTTYLVSEIHVNQGLTEEGLLALPKDAKIIRTPVERGAQTGAVMENPTGSTA
jgi:outer membrane lipoprotein-sorting protein